MAADDRHADILDPDVYVRGVPHATFTRLRDQDPVSWWPEADGPGLWAVTRYDDVVAVSRHSQVFSSASGIRIEDMRPDELAARRTMMELDPPAHTTYRRLVQPPFSFREVASYEQALRLMARARHRGRAPAHDASTSSTCWRGSCRCACSASCWACPTPMARGWWAAATRSSATPIPTSPTPRSASPTPMPYRLMPFRSPVSLELFDYAAEQARQRRERPTDDVISLLLRPTREGAPLTDDEFKNFFTLLVAAGNDTTRYSIAAGMLALLERPTELARLRDAPGADSRRPSRRCCAGAP